MSYLPPFSLPEGDIKQAEAVVYSTYGDTVSVAQKAKNLNKFGRNRTVGTSFETVAELQGTESNETFVSTNLIDGLSSDAAGDTSLTFVVEGHTIDGSGNLTFVSQEVTTDASDGRTEVALGTPMARANRLYLKQSGTFNSPQSAPAGNIYVYDNTGGVAATGIPNNATQTKMVLLAGETQSEKCATSISQSDYWFISFFSASIGDSGGAATRVTVRIETRDVFNGGAWRPTGRDIQLTVDQNGVERTINPYLIVPKNHDVRVVAKTDSNTAEVTAELQGYLAIIV